MRKEKDIVAIKKNPLSTAFNIAKLLLVVVLAYFLAVGLSIIFSKLLMFFGVSKVNATMSALLLSFFFYALIIILIFAQKQFRKSMDALHTWSGLIFGWFLFFIFLTGSVGYFNKELDSYMEPKLAFCTKGFSQQELINIALKELKKIAPNSKKWQIYLPDSREDRLKIRYQVPSRSNFTGMKFNHKVSYITRVIDPKTGAIFRPREDGGGEVLYKMHFLLHYIPKKVGVFIVGVFSMSMFITLLSGIIIHTNIFKDYFTFRKNKNLRSWMDAHVLTGVVALPFYLMITYSGLVFFAFIYMPLISFANYENGVKELRKEALPKESKIFFQNESAPLTSICAISQKAEIFFESPVQEIRIVHPYDTSCIVQVKREDTVAAHNNMLDKLYFNGVNAEMLPTPNSNRPIMSELRKTVMGLHRAHFADTLLRWIFFFSSLLGTIMIATGLILWSKKRELKSRGSFSFRLVNALNIGTLIGLPASFGIYFLTNRLTPDTLLVKANLEINALFLTWFLSILFAFVRDSKKSWFVLAYLNGFIYFSLAILGLLTYNQYSVHSAFNLFFFFIAVAFTLMGHRIQKRINR